MERSRRDITLNPSGRDTLYDLLPDLWMRCGSGIVLDGARKQDGINQSFTVVGWAAGTSDFFFDFWVRSTNTVNGVFYRGNDSATNHGLALSLLSNGVVRLTLYNGTAGTTFSSNGYAVPENQWAHVIVNVDRDGYARFYVDDMVTADAARDVSALSALDLQQGLATHRIGSSASTSSLAISYARLGIGLGLMTEAERVASHRAGLGCRWHELPSTLQEKMVRWWDFAESTAGNATDSVGAYTATQTNGPIAVTPGPDLRPNIGATDEASVNVLVSCDGHYTTAEQWTADSCPTVNRRSIGGETGTTFDGTNDFLECLDSDLLSSTSCTLGIVFKTGATAFATKGVQTLFSFSDKAADNEFWRLGIDANGCLFVECNDSGTTHKVTTQAHLENATVYGVELASDGDAWSIRMLRNELDEPLTVTTANSGKWVGDLADIDSFVLGCLRLSGGDADFFEGDLLDIAVWDTQQSSGALNRWRRVMRQRFHVAPPAIYEGPIPFSFNDLDNWAVGGAGATEAAETARCHTGTQSILLSGTGAATATLLATNDPAVDLTGKAVGIRFHVPNVDNIGTVRLYLFTGGVGANYFYKQFTTHVGWHQYNLVEGDFTSSGSPDWSSIDAMRVQVSAGAALPHQVVWDTLVLGTKSPAIVLCVTDDGELWNYANAKAIFAANSIPVTAYLITDQIGRFPTYRMTEEQCAELYEAGWDLASHTHTHPNLVECTDAQVRYEFETSQQWLLDRGFTRAARHLAYPGNSENAAVRAIAREYFDSGRSYNSHLIYPHVPTEWEQTYKLAGEGADGETVESFSAYVDQVIAHGGVFIPYWHYDITDEVLTGQVEYLASKVASGDIQCMTISQYRDWVTKRFQTPWHGFQGNV